MTREELEKRLESAEKQMIGLQDEIQNLRLWKHHDEAMELLGGAENDEN